MPKEPIEAGLVDGPSKVTPDESLMPSLWRWVWQQPRPIRKAIWWAVPATALSLLLGAGAIIWDGVLFANSHTQWLAIAVGALFLYVPGLCFAGAIFGMVRGHATLVRLGEIAAWIQGVLALGGFVSMHYTSNWAITSVIAIILWATMDFGCVWRLRQAVPWAKVGTAGHHGFDVERAQA